MAISPIEVVSMPTKSQEASHLKAVEHQKPANEQLALNAKFHDAIMRKSEQTVATKKAENPEFRYDGKEKGNNPYYNQRKNKKLKKDEKKSENDKNITNHRGIDIKILKGLGHE